MLIKKVSEESPDTFFCYMLNTLPSFWQQQQMQILADNFYNVFCRIG